MFSWLKRRPKQPVSKRLVVGDEGLRVFGRTTEIASIRWSEVVRLRSWKQDCFAVDRIWLGFDRAVGVEALCVHEEMENFPALLQELPPVFPGVRADWWRTVAFPAFATNHIVLWQAGCAAD